MKKVFLIMAVFMVLLAVNLSASPSAIEPVMSLDTMAGAGAVISAATIVDRPEAPTKTGPIVYYGIIAILVAALVGSAVLLLYFKEQDPRHEKRIHHARDQPAAA